MPERILELINVSKAYSSFSLEQVNFSLTPGRIMGFIGRNGAGKTTTLKAIYGLVKPDGGEILYKGTPSDEDPEFKEDVGLLFGGIDFYPSQKVSTLTSVTKRFYSGWDESVYQKWLKYFDIDENKKIRELSNGMKVKYGLSIALSHGAKLLLLDEPTSGLDPVSRDELLDCLRKLADKRNVAILFSTHVISDLEKVSDDITYIQKGKIIFSGEMGEFKSGYLHVEGEESSLTPAKSSLISHLRVHQGRYEGVIKKEDAASFEGEGSQASLEEIMLSIERGNEDEESPL